MNAGTRPAPTNVAFERPSIWQRIVPVFTGFDGPLSLAILLLAAAGMVTMYSAGFDSGTRFVDHARNMLIAFGILFLVAQIPPQRLMSLAVPLYVIGVILLVAVEFAGVTKKGATRWLNVGVVIQPSEMLKIAVPLGWKAVQTVRAGTTGRELIPVLAATGLYEVAYAVLIALGVVIGVAIAT